MTKKMPPAPKPAPYVPSDYEQGVCDVLDMLSHVVSAIHDAEHQVRGLTIHGSPELRTLLAGVNASANVASHIRSEVEKMATRRLSGRLATPSKPER